jgi:chemotaxis protein MotB
MGARKAKPCECTPGAPLWMATFSDLVTLMMAFFVMLVAMANFDDTQKIEAVIESVHEALGIKGYDRKSLGTAKLEAFTEAVRRQKSLNPTEVKMTQALAKHVSDDFIRMTTTEHELRIRLPERVFFQPASATLHPGAYALIADVATIIAQDELSVRVEGYADGTGSEQANWELSGDRALAVVMALRQKGPVAGMHLQAVAMGAFQPGAAIGEDADWNRRVELVVHTRDASGAAGSRLLERGGPDGGR